MGKHFLRGMLLVCLQFLFGATVAFATDYRTAKIIDGTQLQNNGIFGNPADTTTSLHGYVTDDGGARYVISLQSASEGYIKAGKGLRLFLENHDGNGYTYIDDLDGKYVADSVHSSQSDVVIASRLATKEFKDVADQIFGQIESRFGNASQPFSLSAVDGKLRGGALKGMSAGDQDTLYGVWGQLAWSHLKDTQQVTEFKANLYTGSVGADMKLMDEMLLGLAYSFGVISDGQTEFNRGTFEQKTHSVTPYFAYRFDDCLSVDAMGGYTYVDKDFERTQGYFLGDNTYVFITDDKVTACTKAHRWNLGIFGNAGYTPMDDVTLSTRVGFRYIHEKQKAYDADYRGRAIPHDSLTSKVGRFSARLRAAYMIDSWFEPFVQVGYEYDSTFSTVSFRDGPQVEYDKSGYMVGGGFRAFGIDNWTGVVEATHQFGHSKLQITTLRALLRYVF